MTTATATKQVTEAQLIDHLVKAAKTELRGENGITWEYFHVMTQEEKLAFDLFLVRTKDELAYQPGTPESRFRIKVQRMVELERQRLAARAT